MQNIFPSPCEGFLSFIRPLGGPENRNTQRGQTKDCGQSLMILGMNIYMNRKWSGCGFFTPSQKRTQPGILKQRLVRRLLGGQEDGMHMHNPNAKT